MTVYPTFEEVLGAHARLIERFGGVGGLRDRGALESALARPQTGYYKDIVEQGAALLESLWQNIPFSTATSGRPAPSPPRSLV